MKRFIVDFRSTEWNDETNDRGWSIQRWSYKSKSSAYRRRRILIEQCLLHTGGTLESQERLVVIHTKE